MDMILNAVTVYGAVGGTVALVFVLLGFDRVDAAARGAWLVRPLLVPGLVLLWPVLLARWIVLERRRGQDQ
jgi:hypothetical protein